MPSNTFLKQRARSRAGSATPLIIGLLIFAALLIPFALIANRKVSKHHLQEYSDLWPYVLAQAKHESADFTSNVYKANHNPWGMKVARVRPFLGSQGTKAPDGGYYALYTSDAQAEKDLLEWFRFTRFPASVSSVEEFAAQLKARSYYGDSLDNYIKGLKRFL